MIDDFPEVLHDAQAGGSNALSLLWQEYHHRIVRYLRIRARDQAEDIASETWITVARSLHRFRGDDEQFRAWLFTIAQRRLIDALRRAARRPVIAAGSVESDVVVSMDDEPEARSLVADELAQAEALLRQLPDQQRDVIALRVLADLGVADVAEILGLSSSNVRVIQHRGLQRLRAMLEERNACDRRGDSSVEP
jgi:RNA polymerase sigma-70 factor (ECF subfamily)